MSKILRDLMELFWAFFRIGTFTIGGGYAMLPMLERELIENKGWTSEEEILDYFAIGQSTPGIIAINTATFIGYKRNGVLGSIFATVGMIFTPMLLIMIIGSFFTQISQDPTFIKAFQGIRVVVVVIILNSVSKMAKHSIKTKLAVFLLVGSFIAISFFHVNLIILIVLSMILGIALIHFNVVSLDEA